MSRPGRSVVVHRFRPFPRAAALAALSGLAVLTGACGSSAEHRTQVTLATVANTVLRGAGPGEACHAASPPSVPGEPAVVMPRVAPSKLTLTDLERGTGPQVKMGEIITVQYVGIACSTGTQFDATWDKGQPFTVQLSQGGLIQGWLEGIPGMRAGSRRRIVVPPAWGYGAGGFGKQIRPDETLVFVVDLLSFHA